ncbi:MAG: hypothetical protein QOD77_850 [Thermoplasmata archaeon]|jgi:hypothetical protein|nr:hypothetical protein [Thermoplasmata archaeon]
MASLGAFGQFLLDGEARLQESARKAAPAIGPILRNGSGNDLRDWMRKVYADAYGSGHAFVQALAQPGVNYYRIDSAKAIQYPFAPAARPLILFLANQADCPPTRFAWEATAEERFREYMGCGPGPFAAAVAQGLLLPTVGPMRPDGKPGYTGPFMRGLFQRLAALDDRTWPVSANVLDMLGLRPGRHARRWAGALDAIGKRHPRLLEDRYTHRILGEDSTLAPVVPRAYLKERAPWFDLAMPDTPRAVFDVQLRQLRREPGPKRLARLMDSAFVLHHLYAAPAYYSKGPSIRVSGRDLGHWVSVLQQAGQALDEEARRHRDAKERLEHARNALDTVAQHLPAVVVGGIEGVGRRAGRRFERHIPQCLSDDRMEAILDALDRIGGPPDPEAAAAHQDAQKVFIERPPGKEPDMARLQRSVEALNDTIGGLDAWKSRFDFARRERVRATVQVGGTVPALAMPALKPALRILDSAWLAANKLRHAQAPKDGAGSNPNLQLGLDYLQTPPGDPFVRA